MNLIFISYRREDNPDAAGRVYDRLKSYFGEDSVFFDIDSIPPGVDFRKYISDFVSKCNVLVVIIGERWLANDSSGVSRLENRSDFVRIEIETALKRDIPVIPVPVGKAMVPSVEDLPAEIKDLHYRNAYEVRSGTPFEGHIQRLIKGIENTFKGIKKTEEKPKITRSERIKKTSDKPEISKPGWKILFGIALIAIAGFVVWNLNKGNISGPGTDDLTGPGAEDTKIEKVEQVPKCDSPWEWDSNLKECIQQITIPPKSFSILLSSPISKVGGSIFFYTNRVREDAYDGNSLKPKTGVVQVFIPIMRGKTMVGQQFEVIYSSNQGAICEIKSLPGTTGHLKAMRVTYSLRLDTDCDNSQNFCEAQLVDSGMRVHIKTKALTVKIGKNCNL